MEDEEQRRVYAAFMGIRDKADAVEFWKEWLPSPIGKTYFTPVDYRRSRSAVPATVTRMVSAERRQLLPEPDAGWKFSLKNTVWTVKRLAETWQGDKETAKRILLMSGAFPKLVEATSEWVSSRYAVGDDYLTPSQFYTTAEEVAKLKQLGDLDKEDDLELVEAQQAKLGREVNYYWKQVHPAGEDPTDGRRHVILMDKRTGEEAALKAGQEPYTAE